MVPGDEDRSPPSRGSSADGPPHHPDPGFDEDRLYAVVHRAVEDAVLGAIGTVIFVLIAVGLVWVGIAVVAANPTPLGIVFGGVAIVAGFYLAASSLEVIPPIRAW